MLVFIDDSGDAGFKLDEGSSAYFVIACVIFDDNLDAEETALKIKRFRRSLHWREEHEFKFNKPTKQIRLDFLNTVKAGNFRIRAVVADKSKITSLELRTKQDKFYNYMIKQVLVKSADSIKDGRIRLDGHGDKNYKKAAKAYFRQQANPKGGVIKEMKFVDSKSDNLVQLADMVAGSIVRATQPTKTDSNDYMKVIHKRVEDIWHFQ